MKRYIHPKANHQYEIKRDNDVWGSAWICRQLSADGYGSSLKLDPDQLFTFEGTLIKNGWYDVTKAKA